MGFWITVFILLFIYLVIVLILKVIEDRRVKKSRVEIPGRVSFRINFLCARAPNWFLFFLFAIPILYATNNAHRWLRSFACFFFFGVRVCVCV